MKQLQQTKPLSHPAVRYNGQRTGRRLDQERRV